MGLNQCKNQKTFYSHETTIPCCIGLNCYIKQNIMLHVNFINSLVDGCTNMSHGMSHSSCIHSWDISWQLHLFLGFA